MPWDSDAAILPASVAWLARMAGKLPVGGSAALLLRHSIREDIPEGDRGDDVRLTPEGEALARVLGARLGASGSLRIASLCSSPAPRCVRTAACLAEGGGVALDVAIDRMLGGPGVFVEDLDLTWRSWFELGKDEFLGRLMSGTGSRVPGVHCPAESTRRLVAHLLAGSSAPGLHVFVTHDVLITIAAAHCLGRPLPEPDWPGFLDGALFWPDNGMARIAYRGCVETVLLG